MVDRTESELKGDTIEVGIWRVYEVQVSTNDTITLDAFTASANLDNVMLCKKSDRTEVTTSITNNVVDVTGAGLTNVDCILFAIGVAA